MDDFMATTKRAGHKAELERLANQHAYFKHALDGQLVQAPIDLSQPGLKILDCATADGKSCVILTSTVLKLQHRHMAPRSPLLAPFDNWTFLLRYRYRARDLSN